MHCYDLRNLKTPFAILRDHRKAVWALSFLNQEQLVSAYVWRMGSLCWLWRQHANTSCVLGHSRFKIGRRHHQKVARAQGDAAHVLFRVRTLYFYRLDAQTTHALSCPSRSTIRHTNAKNFTGLTVDRTGEHIICGSEDNQVPHALSLSLILPAAPPAMSSLTPTRIFFWCIVACRFTCGTLTLRLLSRPTRSASLYVHNCPNPERGRAC